jgi:translation elongation factor EF-1beta/ubiquinone/menaquinone biosynthesis C-methylase UbiE
MALPETLDDFATAQFWDTFFTSRGGKAFEWYCEYPAMAKVLRDPRMRRGGVGGCVFHAGCGNSDLCFELQEKAKFDVVVNADFSLLALEEMQLKLDAKPAVVRSQCSFVALDCLSIPFRAEQFHWVIEKGLHDAMMKDSGPECRSSSRQLFGEFARILSTQGKLMIVSLAQEHLVALFQAALQSGLWDLVYVWSLMDAESPLLPFILIFRKASPASATSAPASPRLVFDEASEDPGRFRELITKAQGKFSERRAKCATTAVASAAKAKSSSNHLVVLDVKPCDSDTDLAALEGTVRAMSVEHVTWLPEPFELVPIAFGLRKLRCTCVVATHFRDAASVCDELLSSLDEDQVQSIDVVSSTAMR